MIKKLKNKFGKYFTFENTINGTDYFVRGLAAAFIFIIPFLMLLGIVFWATTSELFLVSIIAMLLLLAVFAFMMWFSLANTWKRINAFWPQHATKLTIIVFILSFITENFNPQNGLIDSYLIYGLLVLPQFIFSLYILFANSKVKKHIG